MQYHSQQDRAQQMHERAMELILIQVDSAKDELERLSLLIEEIEENGLRENMGKYCISAMSILDKIYFYSIV